MKRYQLFFTLIVLSLNTLNAQQAWFTQFNENPILLNPAFTGKEEHLSIRGQYKSLWADLTGAPSTAIISAHSPIGLSSSSIGLILFNDEIGVSKSTGAVINYAYRFNTKVGKIGLGADFSINNYSEKLTATSPAMPNDPLLAADYNTLLFNAGLGLSWEGENGFVGIAIPGMLKPTRSSDADDTIAIDPVQFNFTGSYTIALSDDWEMSPALSYSYIDNLPSQMALIFTFEWENTLGLMAGYRSNNAYSAGFNYRFMENLLIGYSYDYFASSINNVGGGHEVILGFDLNKQQGK